MMYTVSLINNKGGVAKTSSTASLGACLSYHEKKVLLIDLDPQANLTAHFGFKQGEDFDKTIYNAFTDFKDDAEKAQLPLLKVNNNLYLAPSESEFEKIRELVFNYADPYRTLQYLLEPLARHFDICLIDLPPAKDVFAKNALCASDGVLIPIQASKFSLDGVNSLVAFLMQFKKEARLKFDILGAFMSMYDDRKSISKASRSVVEGFFKDKMLKTVIRSNTDIEKAQAEGMDIFRYSGSSNSALDYAKLSDEIIEKIEAVKI